LTNATSTSIPYLNLFVTALITNLREEKVGGGGGELIANVARCPNDPRVFFQNIPGVSLCKTFLLLIQGW
jgi:hypothetical protein